MEQKELEYLRQVEDHASRTGWVSPLTREDKEYFAYLLNKRPNEANIKVRYGCKVKHQTAIIYWRYLQ